MQEVAQLLNLRPLRILERLKSKADVSLMFPEVYTILRWRITSDRKNKLATLEYDTLDHAGHGKPKAVLTGEIARIGS